MPTFSQDTAIELSSPYYRANYEETANQNLLLLLTHQRSGSTWLFDVIRSFPFIAMHPSYFFFSHLGAKGARYPVDLSRSLGDYVKSPASESVIEIRPFFWRKIPRFKQICQCDISNIPFYWIEKIHPHFLSSDNNNLKFDSLLRPNIHIVLVIRSPLETAASFIAYQKRNTGWYKKINPSNIASFLISEYSMLLSIAKTGRAIVIRYDQIMSTFLETIFKIFRFIFSEDIINEHFRFLKSSIERIHIKTKIPNRPDKNSRFFGLSQNNEQVTGGPFLSEPIVNRKVINLYDELQCYSSDGPL